MATDGNSDLTWRLYEDAMARVAKGDANDTDRIIVLNYTLQTAVHKKLDALLEAVTRSPRSWQEHLHDKGPWAGASAAITAALLGIVDYILRRNS